MAHRFLLLCVVLLLAVLAPFFLRDVSAQENSLASIGAGMKSGFMCSAVFLAGRDPAAVLREELQGISPALSAIPDPVIDYEHRAVMTAYAQGEAPRLAVYLEGFGTVLLAPGATLEDAKNLPKVDMPRPGGDPATIPWPDGDLVPKIELPPGVDGQKLADAVQGAFSDEKYAPHFTVGVVVVYRGDIIAERYAPGWGEHVQTRAWSSSKSIGNALVGIMVKEGKLDVKQRVPIPEWKGANDPRGAITIENLMHMSSGLKIEPSDTRDAYWGGIDVGAAIARNPLEVEPGTRWLYSNYDALLLARSIREVIGNDEEYWTLPRRALLNKIGMRDTQPEIDPHGNFIMSSQIYSTARDLARFGLLFLNDGVWNGERILPEGWVAYTTRPAPAKKPVGPRESGYGAQFWLIGTDERVPDDAYTTSGARGQYSTNVPSHDLVVARMGLDPLAGSKWDQAGFVAEIVNAVSSHED